MAWTQERVEALRKLWAEGKSGGEIAGVLGITRSTVMGKIHRLKLPKRATKSTTRRALAFARRERRIAPPRTTSPIIGTWRKPPEVVYAKVDPTDPASIAAQALLAAAERAESRRAMYRMPGL